MTSKELLTPLQKTKDILYTVIPPIRSLSYKAFILLNRETKEVFPKDDFTVCTILNRTKIMFPMNTNTLRMYIKEYATKGLTEVLQYADEISFKGLVRVSSKKCKILNHRDWLKEPISGFLYPLSPSKTVRNLIGLIPGTDIGILWILNRLHHLPILGLAYILTRNKEYINTLQKHILLWSEGNPIGLGPNWINAMEPSIRACNIILSLALASDYFSENINKSKNFLLYVTALLYEHGKSVSYTHLTLPTTERV